jgi:hypothetical protein
MSDEKDGGDDTASWAAASESLRSVVKWVAASFGALGALLIGTAPLASLRRLHSDWHDWLVPIGFGAAALVGVGLIVWLATSLLTPSTITLPEVQTNQGFEALRRMVAADPTAYLGLWGTDIDSFMENRNTEFTALANVDKQIASLADADARLQALGEARPLLLKSVDACGTVSARLLAIAGFHDLSRRFNIAKRKMFAAAVLIVVGVVGYIAITPSGDKADGGEHLAVPALVTLNAHGESDVRPNLGAGCPKPFKAVLLSGDASGPWKVLVIDPKCTNGTLLLSKEQASLIGVFAPG